METKEQGNYSALFWLVIIALITFGCYQLFFAPKWTLFVCSDLLDKNNPYQCYNNAIVLKDEYRNLESCSSVGRTFMNSYPGYECGYKCSLRNPGLGLWLCKTTGGH